MHVHLAQARVYVGPGTLTYTALPFECSCQAIFQPHHLPRWWRV